MKQRVTDEQARAIKDDPDTLVVYTESNPMLDIAACDVAADLLDSRARVAELGEVKRLVAEFIEAHDLHLKYLPTIDRDKADEYMTLKFDKLREIRHVLHAFDAATGREGKDA